MSAPKSKSTKELLKAAKLPERSVSICLRGDLVADIEARELELKALLEARAKDGRLSTGAKARGEKADEIETLRAEMAGSTVTFRLRAMKAADWRTYTAKHQAKSGGIDLLPLMGEAIPASVVEPDDMDAEDWETLNNNVPASEMGKLIDAVWELNMQGVSVPKSPLASAVNRASSEG